MMTQKYRKIGQRVRIIKGSQVGDDFSNGEIAWVSKAGCEGVSCSYTNERLIGFRGQKWSGWSIPDRFVQPLFISDKLELI